MVLVATYVLAYYTDRMSKINDFKDEVETISARYREVSQTGHRAQVISSLLEARILSILKIGRPLLEMSEADLSPIPNLLAAYKEAREATPSRAELADFDHPIFDDTVLGQAKYIEEAINPTSDHDPVHAAQLIQGALTKLSSAFDELDQAKDILFHSGIKIEVAGKQAEHIVSTLDKYRPL